VLQKSPSSILAPVAAPPCLPTHCLCLSPCSYWASDQAVHGRQQASDPQPDVATEGPHCLLGQQQRQQQQQQQQPASGQPTSLLSPARVCGWDSYPCRQHKPPGAAEWSCPCSPTPPAGQCGRAGRRLCVEAAGFSWPATFSPGLVTQDSLAELDLTYHQHCIGKLLVTVCLCPWALEQSTPPTCTNPFWVSVLLLAAAMCQEKLNFHCHLLPTPATL